MKSGYAPVNGIEVYYEIHGRNDGVPLLLLHGGGPTIDVTFGPVLPDFASNGHVIAIEEQGTDAPATATLRSRSKRQRTMPPRSSGTSGSSAQTCSASATAPALACSWPFRIRASCASWCSPRR
jgi:pimeloyl-ACP methyl ester carboxylesterase